MKSREVIEVEMLIERLDNVNTTPSKLTIIRTLSTLYENSLFALVSVNGHYFAADSNPNDGKGIVFNFSVNPALMILNKSIAYENETLIFKEKLIMSRATLIGQTIADSDLGGVTAFGHRAMGYIEPDEKKEIWRTSDREVKIPDIQKITIEPITSLSSEELFLQLPVDIDTENDKRFVEHIFNELYKSQKYILVIQAR